MSLSMYAASAVVYVRMLHNLLAWLDKAEGHAKARGFDSGVFLGSKLSPDMLSFGKQRQTLAALESKTAGLNIVQDKNGTFVVLPKGAKVDDSGWTVGKQQALRIVR